MINIEKLQNDGYVLVEQDKPNNGDIVLAVGRKFDAGYEWIIEHIEYRRKQLIDNNKM